MGVMARHTCFWGRNGPRETSRGVVRNPLASAMGRFKELRQDLLATDEGEHVL